MIEIEKNNIQKSQVQSIKTNNVNLKREEISRQSAIVKKEVERVLTNEY